MDHALSGGMMRAVSAAVRSTPVPLHEQLAGGGQPGAPFVTISREGGAGGRMLAERLIDRLNQLDPGDEPWTLWDRELVEKVSAEHHIAMELVESLGETHRTWMQQFLGDLSQVGEIDEAKVYRRVAMAIRAIAQRGRAVIIGRGGVFVTRHMPGGVHVRMIAPLEYRVAYTARQYGMTPEEARQKVMELDRNRNAFFRRYWPQAVADVNAFTVTLNVSRVDEERATEALIPLVLRGSSVTVSDRPHAMAGAGV